MLRPVVLLAIIVALGVASQPANAQEPIDISGEWLIEGLGFGPEPDPCPLVVSQAGTLLAAAAECIGGIHLQGEIDSTSGEFALGGPSKAFFRFDFVGTASNDRLILSSSRESIFTSQGLEARRSGEAPERHSLSGNWRSRLSGEAEGTGCMTAVWHRDEAITIDLECRDARIAHLTGAIDMETGRFSVSGDLFGSVGHLEGVGSRSGRALSAVWSAAGVGSGTLTSHLDEQTGGALAVDCDGGTEGIQSSCAYDAGTTFRVQLHLTDVPPDGYNGFALNMRWTTPQLSYIRSESTEDELLEPNCELAARGSQWAREPRAAIISFVCMNEPFPQGEPLTVGVAVEVTMECSASGSGTLTLSEGNSATLFVGGVRSVPQQILPHVTDASVWCRPDASPQPGDANCNGLVNSIDALLVLQLESMRIRTLACIDRADSNQDGNVNSIDAALILQFAAGLMAAQAASS